MPGSLPTAVKDRARELYVGGETPARISNILNSEFELVDGRPYKASTVSGWAKQGRWDLARREQEALALARVTDTASVRTQAELEEQLEVYRQVRRAVGSSYEQLEKSETAIKLRNAKDLESSAKAADVASQGIQRLQEGVFTQQFISDVLVILVDEITDSDLRQRIALRLKQLALQQLKR